MQPISLPAMKDRKVRRRVDMRAARTSVFGLLGALVVYALLVSWGGLYRDHESLALMYGLAIVAVAAYRLLLVVRFESMYGSGPVRWRRLFGIGLIAHATAWGSLLAVIVLFYGVDARFLLACVYIIGVSTALGTSWMGNLRVRIAYALIMLLPAMSALLLAGGEDHWLLAGLLGVYVIYLVQMYRDQYLGFWHVMNRERRPPLSAKPRMERIGGIQLSLVYRLAHEIRTPMNSIMGMLSLLRDTPLNEEQLEYHLLASQSGKLLLTLIDDVLDYSRILSGRITLNEEFFDFRQAMEESLEAFGPAAQQKDLELSCAIDRHMPRRLRGDRERVMQVVNNLISNAVKFSERGEIFIRARFDALASDEGMLRVSVCDEGPGMDEDTRKALFQDMIIDGQEEADLFAARRTGFGLLVCRGLVEAMRGEISVESTPGEGSDFSFSARLRMQQDMSGRDPLQDHLSGACVLVAGASRGAVQGLEEEFEALDAHVQPTSDYDHALQALREGRREGFSFRLLLVDSHERTGSAINLCRTVLADPALGEARLILMLSVQERAHPAVQELLVRSSRIEVLVKPVHRRGLRASLLRLLGLESEEPVADKRLPSGTEQALRRRFRLLLVEDNEINQIVTRGMLDKLGYQVKAVPNGQAALELLGRERFDLILMDCMMPEMDGFDTARAIRRIEQDEPGRRIPIIATTANTIEGAQARCLAAGMDDYLAKPIHLEDLENVLAHWLPSLQAGANREEGEG